MRLSFINTLTRLAKKDKKIFLLTGDLGFSVFQDFRRNFPDRFFNIGVAEQNMIGIAAGLALSGKVVFVYSIIPFATMRCFEQIRNDLCMQNLNVNIIGMGAGLHYGSAGPTHHAIEDMGIMRILPNMTVLSPSTPKETEEVVKSVIKHEGPAYIRLGKSYGLVKPHKQTEFSIGKARLIDDGYDITIISTGAILYTAREAAKILKKEGICSRLINIHTIKPIDRNIILKAARETEAIFTVEEHSLIGGLGTAVSEVLSESTYEGIFKRLALPDNFIKSVGSREYLNKKNRLSANGIATAVLKRFGAVKK